MFLLAGDPEINRQFVDFKLTAVIMILSKIKEKWEKRAFRDLKCAEKESCSILA